MEDFTNFKELYQTHISCDDFNILYEFYFAVKNSGKYAKMVAFVYEKKNFNYNIVSKFVDLICDYNINELGSFKLYNKRSDLIIISEKCKGKNKKLNECVRNLIFYEQPILYGGNFIKGVFNKDILDKTHVIYVE
jgi:hypothetical protein